MTIRSRRDAGDRARARAPSSALPEDFLFLFSFDYLSVFERKNPLAVVEAFARAFDPGDGAMLVIKCINGDTIRSTTNGCWPRPRAAPDIQIIDRYLTPREKDALTAACDCYVSLHRSEGFGLTMAEAMYLGKPVIATAYSGNLDFMTAENSLLVDTGSCRSAPARAPYPAEGEWAEPDVDRAAGLMRGCSMIPRPRPRRRRAPRRSVVPILPAPWGAVMNDQASSICAAPTLRHTGGAANGRRRWWSPRSPRAQRGPAPGRLDSGPVGRTARRACSARCVRSPPTRRPSTRGRSLAGAVGDLESARIARTSRADARKVLAELRRLEPVALPAMLETHSRAIDDLEGSSPGWRRVDRLDDGFRRPSLYMALAELAGVTPRLRGPASTSTPEAHTF